MTEKIDVDSAQPSQVSDFLAYRKWVAKGSRAQSTVVEGDSTAGWNLESDVWNRLSFPHPECHLETVRFCSVGSLGGNTGTIFSW